MHIAAPLAYTRGIAGSGIRLSETGARIARLALRARGGLAQED
jgi:hypothetical protein